MPDLIDVEQIEKNTESSEKIMMPDVRGKHIVVAHRILQNLGFIVGTVLYDEFNCPVRSVFDQSVPPYEYVTPETTVDLKVASDNPIRNLPSLYQNNKTLKDFLWVFQHIINSFQNNLDIIHTYFNPLETTREFYKWLASWFSINVNYAISEDKMRGLIWNAVNLYQWRGTALGLTKYLEIITEIKPEIIENYVPLTEYIIETNQLIEKPIVEKSNFSQCFTVKFPVPTDHFDLDTIKKIYNIIQTEKPAHTHFYLIFSSPKKEKIVSQFIIGETIIGEQEQI
ncbi:MAG: PASTA domain-containing protein [Spirochaetales bacterium]|nr:PASTA domain-containing protein [Spirochaetales bacterium]